MGLVYNDKSILVNEDHFTLGCGVRLEIERTSLVKDLKRKIREALDIQAPMTLLVAGKKLQDDQQTVVSLLSSQTKEQLHILVLSTGIETIQRIQESKSDPLMRPLESQKVKRFLPSLRNNKRDQRRMSCQLVPLEGFSDKQRAQEILERLASERGVVAVVEKYNLSVARLSEMYPHGKVGIDPVCVLGLNKGDEIQLRLRTDDLQGFRSYDTILKVLFHELAHCRYGEHNREFYAFMNRLEKEANEADWTKHGGRRIMEQVTSGVVPITEESANIDNHSHSGVVLGGKQSHQSPREAAVAAALLRMNTNTEQGKGAREEDEENSHEQI